MPPLSLLIGFMLWGCFYQIGCSDGSIGSGNRGPKVALQSKASLGGELFSENPFPPIPHKGILIHFFADCGKCLEEIWSLSPHLDSLASTGYSVLFLGHGQAREMLAYFWKEKLALPYPLFFDQDSIFLLTHQKLFPEAFSYPIWLLQKDSVTGWYRDWETFRVSIPTLPAGRPVPAP